MMALTAFFSVVTRLAILIDKVTLADTNIDTVNKWRKKCLSVDNILALTEHEGASIQPPSRIHLR
jgi:hypothetical protein